MNFKRTTFLITGDDYREIIRYLTGLKILLEYIDPMEYDSVFEEDEQEELDELLKKIKRYDKENYG